MRTPVVHQVSPGRVAPAVAVLIATVIAGTGSLMEWMSIDLDIPLQSINGVELPVAGWLVGGTTVVSIVAAGLLVVRPSWVALAWLVGGLGLLTATMSGLSIILLSAGSQISEWVPRSLLPDEWADYVPSITLSLGLWTYFVGSVIQCGAASRAALVAGEERSARSVL